MTGPDWLPSVGSRPIDGRPTVEPGASMEITTATARRISQSAWIMAALGTVVGQVHALARAQAHPGDFAESPLARVWGEPAIRMLKPLLDWSDPWTVYVT